MGTYITTNVFLLVVIWNLWPCSNANSLQGCECNIMDACDAQGKPKPNWAQYLPSGVDKFGYVVQRAQNLAYLCEGGTVTILFDGNSRIPLYSATVMTGQQLSAGSTARPSSFRQSKEIDRKYQQKAADYQKSSQRNICFKKKATNTLEVDKKWASSVAKPGSANVCLQAAIHKGHLIASQYGRGDKERMKATFTYTNIIPQFGSFNSVPWQQCESSLIMWGRKNCATGTQNVKLFIVVGAIPSTYPAFGPSEERFFGKEGFSDYQDEDDYPVNMPKLMWTAACCSFEYTDSQGTLQTGIKSTAFWRENEPGGSPCNRDTTGLNKYFSGISIFPLTPSCSHNFVSL